jgi:predicted transcriptional regulator
MQNEKIALLSIKPIFADSIFDGEKKFEFRKAGISPDVKLILVYSSSPVKAFIGFIEIDEVITGSPASLWKKTGDAGAISRTQFFSYFEGKKLGYAIKIKSIRKFETSVNPRELLEDFHPPQSFMYVNGNVVKKLAKKFNADDEVSFRWWCSRSRQNDLLQIPCSKDRLRARHSEPVD